MRIDFKRGLFRLWIVLSLCALPVVLTVAVDVMPTRERIMDTWRFEVATAFSELHERQRLSNGPDRFFEILGMPFTEVQALTTRQTATYWTTDTPSKPVKLSDVLFEKALTDAATKRDTDIARLTSSRIGHFAIFLGSWLAAAVGVYLAARVLGWVFSGFKAA
jgi:hypothetical protein